nr:MFS transporter [Caldanaerobius polysaccharolyticus]
MSLSGKLQNAFPALTHRNFRLFWIGQCISLIGTWMQNIGQAWLVLKLTNSAFKLGLVSALQFLPMMFLSLFVGTLVDRFPKRKVLLFTQSSLMILAAVLATLTYFDVIRYWHVLVLALLLGFVNTLDNPTRQSFIIELVGRKDLMNAIALNSSIFNLARILGPAVAGVLIGVLGIAVCFYLNALSFIAVLTGLWLIDVPDRVYEKKEYSVLKDLMEGLIYISARPIIYLPLILLAFISTFVMNFNVIIPVFAKHDLHKNAMGYGFLMTSMGIGSLIGALTLAARSRMGPRIKVLMGGALGMSAFQIVLSFEKNYWLAAFTLLVVGFCSIVFTASVNTTLQLNSDDHIRGRIMSVYALVFGGVTPVGSLYAGKLTEEWGASTGFAVSGLIGVLSALAVMYMYFLKKGSKKAVL